MNDFKSVNSTGPPTHDLADIDHCRHWYHCYWCTSTGYWRGQQSQVLTGCKMTTMMMNSGPHTSTRPCTVGGNQWHDVTTDQITWLGPMETMTDIASWRLWTSCINELTALVGEMQTGLGITAALSLNLPRSNIQDDRQTGEHSWCQWLHTKLAIIFLRCLQFQRKSGRTTK